MISYCRKAAKESDEMVTIDETWNTTECKIEYLCNLKARWDDEHEYEDINEYLKVIQKNVCENAFKINKKPFGFSAKCDDGEIFIYIKIKGNRAEMYADIKRNQDKTLPDKFEIWTIVNGKDHLCGKTPYRHVAEDYVKKAKKKLPDYEFTIKEIA